MESNRIMKSYKPEYINTLIIFAQFFERMWDDYDQCPDENERKQYIETIERLREFGYFTGRNTYIEQIKNPVLTF